MASSVARWEKPSGDILYEIFKHLDGIDLAKAACVNDAWRRAAQEERLWHRICLARWPSVGSTVVKDALQSAQGFRRFYMAAYQTLAFDHPVRPSHNSSRVVRFPSVDWNDDEDEITDVEASREGRLRLSDLTLLVDIAAGGTHLYSCVLTGEALSSEFRKHDSLMVTYLDDGATALTSQTALEDNTSSSTADSARAAQGSRTGTVSGRSMVEMGPVSLDVCCVPHVRRLQPPFMRMSAAESLAADTERFFRHRLRASVIALDLRTLQVATIISGLRYGKAETENAHHVLYKLAGWTRLPPLRDSGATSGNLVGRLRVHFELSEDEGKISIRSLDFAITDVNGLQVTVPPNEQYWLRVFEAAIQWPRRGKISGVTVQKFGLSRWRTLSYRDRVWSLVLGFILGAAFFVVFILGIRVLRRVR